MKYLETIISEDEKKDELYNRILQKDKMQWKRFNNPQEILKWLDNFATEREVYLALILADNIGYYNIEEIRHLWNILLANRVKERLIEQNISEIDLRNVQKWFLRYLREKCIFVEFGASDKSAPPMLNLFLQSIDVKGLKSMELYRLLHGKEKLDDKKTVFLLDDFIGSGTQAKITWESRIDGKSLQDLKTANPHIEFIYIVPVGCTCGKKYIEENTPIKVIICEELDEKFKCFSDTSIIFKDADERNEAKRVMESKGRMLYEHPLGYKDMQLAVAFHHNTPNDCLPVIWKRMKDKSWYPLFERFEVKSSG